MSVASYLDCTTGQIPQAEANLLPAGTDYIVAEAHEYGWWVWVPEDTAQDDEQEQEFRAACPHLAALMDHARTLGCRYVRLDADGGTIDGLPTFEW